jgi:hypothetical protein
MRKFIIAAASVSALASSAPAFADGVYFGIDAGPRYYDDRGDYDPPPPRYRYRPHYAYDDGDDYYRPRYVERQHCWKEPYEQKSHHHYVTKYRTVCR